jgi:hypothetical protein
MLTRAELEIEIRREKMLISRDELDLKKFIIVEDVERLKNIVLDCSIKVEQMHENKEPKTRQEMEQQITRRKLLLCIKERDMNILDRMEEISRIDDSINDINNQLPKEIICDTV